MRQARGAHEATRIADGRADLTQRAQQWNAVERATDALNGAARGMLGGEAYERAGELDAAQVAYANALGTWEAVATAQDAVIQAAAHEPALLPEVAAIEGALDEYQRISGNTDRMPGVGGLS